LRSQDRIRTCMLIGVYCHHAVYVFKHVLSKLRQFLHQLDNVYHSAT